MLIASLVLLAGTGISHQDPAFAKYPAEPAMHGSPVQPQMLLPKARRFQTVLRNAASEGPNFNGHYRVAKWGCGTNCIEWAVIDLTDGKVWFAPEPAYSCWAPGEPSGLEWPEWIEIRIDSRLFYLHECIPGGESERTFNKRHAYEWRGDRPTLLKTEPYLAKGEVGKH
jgi:hypothetical protein